MAANFAKLKTMKCQPGAIILGVSDEAFLRRSKGKGSSYWGRLRIKIPCLDFVVEMMLGSMTDHFLQLHRTDLEIDWDRLPMSQHECLPQLYEVSSPKTTSKCQRPFQGCPGPSRTRSGLRNHFNRTHWKHRIQILEYNPMP